MEIVSLIFKFSVQLLFAKKNDLTDNERLKCLHGEMAERSKAHAWKVCIRKRIEGSNPSFSANI